MENYLGTLISHTSETQNGREYTIYLPGSNELKQRNDPISLFFKVESVLGLNLLREIKTSCNNKNPRSLRSLTQFSPIRIQCGYLSSEL